MIIDGLFMFIIFNYLKNFFWEFCRIYKNSVNKFVRLLVVYFVLESGKEDLLEEEVVDIGGLLREFFIIVLELFLKEIVF